MLKIAFHPIYNHPLPTGHRFPMAKYELLPQQLLYEGTITEENFFAPSMIPMETLLLTHDTAYLNKLLDQTLDQKEIRKIGFPMSPQLVERSRTISNGTFLAINYAQKYGVSMNIAGGTHHAFADRGEGFCIFNDIAVSANAHLNLFPNTKILVIDLDVHKGNGTAKLFEQEPRVFTFSMHGEKNYPVRKEISNLDIGLPDKADDQLYLTTLKDILPRLIDEVEPDLIFYLSGVDVLETDRLGRLSLSLEGCKQRDHFVLQTCKTANIPVVVSMGGGYSERLVHIIEAHANTYRMAQQIYF